MRVQYKQNMLLTKTNVFKTVLLMLHFYDSVLDRLTIIGISCTKVNSNNMQPMVPVGLK